MTSLIHFLALALPYLALTAGLAATIRGHWRQSGGAARLRLHALMTAAVVSHAFIAWGIWAIFASTSSTAAIGLIFLPFYGLGVALGAFAIAWAVFTCAALATTSRRRFGWPAPRWTHLALAAAIVAATVAGGGWGTQRYRLLAEAESVATPLQRLEEIAGDAVAAKDVDVLAKVARNQASDLAILERIFDHCLSVGPIHGQAPCYQVFAYIAGNKAASPAILAVLGEAEEATILTAVGLNPNTPPAVLEAIARNPDSLVRYWVAKNPGLPLPALTALADDPDKLVRDWARGVLQRRTGKAPAP